ncbi:MAG: phage protein Gp27 family protein [Aristaeellaceae bacterium]
MAERTMNRVHCRIDEFPQEVREKVDAMLADPQMTYQDIAEELTQAGYEISKSAIHRYASRTGIDQTRLREIGEQTRRLVRALKDNQDVEATEVANALLLDALTRRIATAEDEFDDMPVEKAGRLLVMLQRSTVYKARTMEDKRRLIARMQDAFLSRLREQVQEDDALMARLSELVEQTGQEVLASES